MPLHQVHQALPQLVCLRHQRLGRLLQQPTLQALLAKKCLKIFLTSCPNRIAPRICYEEVQKIRPQTALKTFIQEWREIGQGMARVMFPSKWACGCLCTHGLWNYHLSSDAHSQVLFSQTAKGLRMASETSGSLPLSFTPSHTRFNLAKPTPTPGRWSTRRWTQSRGTHLGRPAPSTYRGRTGRAVDRQHPHRPT